MAAPTAHDPTRHNTGPGTGPKTDEHHASDEELLAAAIPIDISDDAQDSDLDDADEIELEPEDESADVHEHGVTVDQSDDDLESAARNIGMLHHRKEAEQMAAIDLIRRRGRGPAPGQAEDLRHR